MIRLRPPGGFENIFDTVQELHLECIIEDWRSMADVLAALPSFTAFSMIAMWGSNITGFVPNPLNDRFGERLLRWARGSSPSTWFPKTLIRLGC